MQFNNLGFMYKMGFGVDEDLKCAFYCYETAAELGNAKAQNNVAHFYQNGIATEKN